MDDDSFGSVMLLIGFICFFGLVGFTVRTCSARPNPSVECAKVPGATWRSESVTANGHLLEGYCSK